MNPNSSLPNFIIIGAMKSATTSLYSWLRDQPDVFVAHPKETNFFSREGQWGRGVKWYEAQFVEALPAQLKGEASVDYSSPAGSRVAAQRMFSVVPHAKLVYVIRHPIDRMRSHYRHEVQRGRERRSLLEALEEPDNPYVGNSQYHRCLLPYIERFPRDQICVVRFDDLIRDGDGGWRHVLAHLDLPDRDVVRVARNVTREKAQYTAPVALLKRLHLLRYHSRFPAPIRKIGKRAFTRGGEAFQARLDGSLVPIPRGITAPIWEDVAGLEEWLGVADPLWDPKIDAAQPA
jgi:Sulfotransferase family